MILPHLREHRSLDQDCLWNVRQDDGVCPRCGSARVSPSDYLYHDGADDELGCGVSCGDCGYDSGCGDTAPWIDDRVDEQRRNREQSLSFSSPKLTRQIAIRAYDVSLRDDYEATLRSGPKHGDL